MLNLEDMIRIGGFIHFAVLTASAVAPHVLDWKNELAKITPFLRSLFWIYGGFIVLTITGFGLTSILLYQELASGSPLARWFCGFIAVFWTSRLLVQFLVFKPKSILKTRLLRAGYHCLTIAFTYMSVVYTYTALLSGESP